MTSPTDRHPRTVAGPGSGSPLVLLHGVSLSAAVWAPLFPALCGHAMLAVDLPGHGLSDPDRARRGQVRQHAQRADRRHLRRAGLDQAPVVGHSLGGMLALWYAAAGTERISGCRDRGAGSRAPGRPCTNATVAPDSPRPGPRRLAFAQPASRLSTPPRPGSRPGEVAAAPDSLIEALRLSARRPGNARTVSSLMHAIDHFRRPRIESVLTTRELPRSRPDDVHLGIRRPLPQR